MKNESKKLLAICSLLVVSGFLVNTVSAAAGFKSDVENKVVGNCSLRKEYNYFMNQWTTNEVCNPKVYEIPARNTNIGNQNQNITGNIYLGNSYSYSAPANTRGFYTGNNNAYSVNTWNGYGNSSNYLLSSFGGGYRGDNGSYLTDPYYSYGGYYYPNSVGYYTPTIYSRGYDYDDDYYYSSTGGGSYGYNDVYSNSSGGGNYGYDNSGYSYGGGSYGSYDDSGISSLNYDNSGYSSYNSDDSGFSD